MKIFRRKIRSPQPIILDYFSRIPPESRSETRVLDLPAGNGVLMIPLRIAGFNVTGCDLFPEYAEKNLKRFSEKGVRAAFSDSCKGVISDSVFRRLFSVDDPIVPARIDLVAGDMEDRLPFDDGAFDYVACVEGIEHLDAQYRFINELRRVTKHGGKLLLTTPNMLCLRSRVSYALTGQRTFKTFVDEHTEVHDRSADNQRVYHGHVFLIDYFQLRYYLHNSGFRIERLLRLPLSPTSCLFAIPLIPLMILAAPWGVLNAYRRFQRMKRLGKLGEETKVPYREIMCHVFSPSMLFGSVIALEAVAV